MNQCVAKNLHAAGCFTKGLERYPFTIQKHFIAVLVSS